MYHTILLGTEFRSIIDNLEGPILVFHYYYYTERLQFLSITYDCCVIYYQMNNWAIILSCVYVINLLT